MTSACSQPATTRPISRRVWGGSHGHLSNAQAAAALARLVGPDTETVVAMHLSQENNRPSVAVRELAAAVGAELVAGEDGRPEARTPDRVPHDLLRGPGLAA